MGLPAIQPVVWAGKSTRGLSVNSPTFSSAAAYTAAYTFSAASLHTPRRTPSRVSKRNPTRPPPRLSPRQPNRTPSRKPRHENPCRQPLRLVRCSPSDVPLTAFPADSRPEPRLVCRTGRASRYGVRRGRCPEARLGVRWGSLRAVVAVFDPGVVSGTSSRFGVRHVSRSGCRHGSGVRSGDVERAA